MITQQVFYTFYPLVHVFVLVDLRPYIQIRICRLQLLMPPPRMRDLQLPRTPPFCPHARRRE